MSKGRCSLSQHLVFPVASARSLSSASDDRCHPASQFRTSLSTVVGRPEDTQVGSTILFMCSYLTCS